jgi:hypothetical protein
VQPHVLKSIVPFATALIACLAAAGIWMKMQYRHSAEIETAEKFVKAIRAKEYDRAFELTTRARTWGYDGEDFLAFAPRQLCGAFAMKEVFPIQSNGNRLRKRLSGQKPDMPEVNVQYTGDCFFRVTLRREASGEWKVLKFGSHAG